MKIAIIENHQPLPAKVYGGIERITLFHFAAQCILKEIDITLICLAGSTVDEYANGHGKIKMLSPDEMKALISGKLPFRSVVGTPDIPDIPDILLTNNSEEMFPIDLTGTKTIRACICHGDRLEKTNNKYQFFLTEGQLNAHKRHKPDFDEKHKNLFLVANGIDPSWYAIDPPTKENPKDEIVWLSAMDWRKSPKRVGIIAEALRRVITTAGVGDVKEFDTVRINHLGPIKGEEEKRKLFARAEVYLHTAHDPIFNDPCPTTLLEAQMCGVPVVGFKSGGVEEIVYDKSLIFDKVEDLIECLRRKEYLKHKPEDIRKWCIENHSHIAMAKRYNVQFKKLLEIAK